MNRTEFLKQLGLGGSSLLAVYCGGGCSSDANPSASTSVDFTLDLTNSSYSTLNANGGYVIYNNVVVAKTTTGSYVAVTRVCSHQGEAQVVYDASGNEFYCPVHGARYSTAGTGLNSNGSNGIRAYKTSLSGNSLHVYS